MTSEAGKGSITAHVKALVEAPQERGVWHADWRIEKYHDGVVEGTPDEVLEVEGNLLVNVGIVVMLNLLARNTGTVYSTAANAYLDVGSDSTPAAAGDTTLGATRQRKQATAVVSAQTVTFQATFAAGEADGTWLEVGVFNAAGVNAGDMLNHLVSDLGTKGASSVWVLTLTITIS